MVRKLRVWGARGSPQVLTFCRMHGLSSSPGGTSGQRVWRAPKIGPQCPENLSRGLVVPRGTEEMVSVLSLCFLKALLRRLSEVSAPSRGCCWGPRCCWRGWRRGLGCWVSACAGTVLPGSQCPCRGLPGPEVSPLPSSLLPEARHLKIPQPAQGFALLQEPGVTPECGEGEEDEPVVRGAPGRGF